MSLAALPGPHELKIALILLEIEPQSYKSNPQIFYPILRPVHSLLGCHIRPASAWSSTSNEGAQVPLREADSQKPFWDIVVATVGTHDDATTLDGLEDRIEGWIMDELRRLRTVGSTEVEIFGDRGANKGHSIDSAPFGGSSSEDDSQVSSRLRTLDVAVLAGSAREVAHLAKTLDALGKACIIPSTCIIGSLEETDTNKSLLVNDEAEALERLQQHRMGATK